MTRGITMLRPVLLVVLVVALVLALLLALLVLGQRRLIYLADPAAVPPVASYFPDGRDVRLTTADELTLAAWYVPATGQPDRELAVLVAPGNAGNRAGRVPLARALSQAGFAVLLLDYRGYGGNPGNPTEAGLALDALAAHDYLTEAAGHPPARIIYFGESLGAGVVTALASQRPPGGLVLRSPFEDLAEVAATHYPFLPVRTLLWDEFPVAEQVAGIEAPTAVVFGSRDSVVPARQSRAVAQRAAGLVLVSEIPGADHNDPAMASGPEIVAAVEAVADALPAR